MPQQIGGGISAGQAAYVLDRLVAERRISPREIAQYLGDVPREIAALERRISVLRGLVGDVERENDGTEKTRPTSKRSKRSSRRPTEGQRLHGSYIGFLRQIPERERPNYARLREKKGVEAAIAAMKKALGK